MTALPVFSDQQQQEIKLHLAGKVAAMMGRKWEEGDWSAVYCAAKGIPDAGWSNLNIDVNHQGAWRRVQDAASTSSRRCCD